MEYSLSIYHQFTTSNLHFSKCLGFAREDSLSIYHQFTISIYIFLKFEVTDRFPEKSMNVNLDYNILRLHLLVTTFSYLFKPLIFKRLK